jgi:hypothetical protein
MIGAFSDLLQRSRQRESKRKKVTMAIVLMLALVLSTVGIAGAVTDGELDGDAHPQVVLILMEVNNAPAYRCSGTLIAPKVVLTAGHCTNNYPDSPYTGMRIFTESDVEAGIGTTNNYPYGGGDFSIERSCGTSSMKLRRSRSRRRCHSPEGKVEWKPTAHFRQ